MRFLAYLSILPPLLASTIYAQTIAQEVALLPTCAYNCLTIAAASAGCSITDYACICGSGRTAVQRSAIPCIASNCTVSEDITIQSLATEICMLEFAAESSSVSMIVFPTTYSASPSPTGESTTSVEGYGGYGGSSGSSSSSDLMSSTSSTLSPTIASSATTAITTSASRTASGTAATVSAGVGSRFMPPGLVFAGAVFAAIL